MARKPEDPLAVARAIAEDSAIRDCLFLVKNNVPFDVAFTLDEQTRTAWCVILGELEGGRFDWAHGVWIKADP